MHYFVGSRSFKEGNSLKEILWEDTQWRYVLDKFLGSPFPSLVSHCLPLTHFLLVLTFCFQFTIMWSTYHVFLSLLFCFIMGSDDYGLWTKFWNCVPKQILPFFSMVLLENNSMRKITDMHFLSSVSFYSLCDSVLPQYTYYLIFRY